MLLLKIVFLYETISLCQASSNVLVLDQDGFEELVKPGKEFWLIKFYKPGCQQCDKFAPVLEKLADALSGVIKVGSVNTEQDETLSNEYKIKGSMEILLFGADKNKPKHYEGDPNIKDLTDFVLSRIKKTTYKKLGLESKQRSDVVVLNDKNFDREVLKSEQLWMVEFFAPWCGHCKNLKPEWERAASEMKGKVKFGAIDCTKNPEKSKQYEIQGFPTIIFFSRGSKQQKYEGRRRSNEMVEWAMEKYADALPGSEIVEITNEEVLLSTCQNAPLCILSFLPEILDCQSECRQNYLAILKKVAEKFKMNAWGWVWSEGGSQGDLEGTLGTLGIGYPTLVVANVKKMKYALFKGSFTAPNIEDFLRDVVSGRKVDYHEIKAEALPKINERTPWDGKDSKPPPTGEDNEDVVKEEL